MYIHHVGAGEGDLSGFIHSCSGFVVITLYRSDKMSVIIRIITCNYSELLSFAPFKTIGCIAALAFLHSEGIALLVRIFEIESIGEGDISVCIDCTRRSLCLTVHISAYREGQSPEISFICAQCRRCIIMVLEQLCT